MEHPEKILNDAVEMYSSRVAIAIEERRTKYRNVGMFVSLGAGNRQGGRIVPDLPVYCLDREQVLERVAAGHPSVSGALSMFELTADIDEKIVVFGVLLPDGGVLATTLQVHDADRDRR